MAQASVDPPGPAPLSLKDSVQLLTSAYAPEERGWAKTDDNLYYVATNTHMPGITGAMVDWWFGYVTTTEEYKRWHPIDHIYSEWSGPHGNSTYVGGNHLVYEMIGGQEQHLRINFKSPGDYFGDDYLDKFQTANVVTAVCGRVALWTGKGTPAWGLNIGHLIHLVHTVPDGVIMRSRFWLGDIEGLHARFLVPINLVTGLVKHATEEMGYLKTFLADLYAKETAPGTHKREVVPWSKG